MIERRLKEDKDFKLKIETPKTMTRIGNKSEGRNKKELKKEKVRNKKRTIQNIEKKKWLEVKRLKEIT